MDALSWIKNLVTKGKLIISDALIGGLLTVLMIMSQYIQIDYQTAYAILVGLTSLVTYNMLIIMEIH